MPVIDSYSEFEKTFSKKEPSPNWVDPLKALWYDAKGDWHTAHEIVDGLNDAIAKWVHAYLHRKEGDDWNAKYWYRQAGKPFPSRSLNDEHRELVKFILLD